MDFLNHSLFSHWALVALTASVLGAFIALVNQKFKQDGFMLALVGSFVLSLAWAVPALAIDWPDAPFFYVATMLGALFFCFGDIRQFNMSAQYGGGMASRFKSLVLPLVFVLWLPLSGFFLPESLVVTYMAEPLRALALVGLIGAMFYVSFWLSRNDAISRAGLLFFLPAVLAISFGNIFNKMAMSSAEITSAVVLYNFVLWTTKWVSLVLFMRVKPALREKYKLLRERKLWLAAACFSGLSLLFNPLKNIAIAHAPHPAYVMVIFQTAPFIISFIYMMLGIKEVANVKVGLMLSILGIIFVLLVL